MGTLKMGPTAVKWDPGFNSDLLSPKSKLSSLLLVGVSTDIILEANLATFDKIKSILYILFVVLVVKNLPANAGDVRDAGLIPGLGKSPGGGHGNSVQYSCLENPMDRGAWWAMVHRVSKSWTWLKRLSTQHDKIKYTHTFLTLKLHV